MARVTVYRTFRWLDKDPTIDAIRTVVQDEHLKEGAVSSISGVASATLKAWFGGATKKPQNATLTAVSSALGYVRHDKLNTDGTVAIHYEKARSLDWKKEIEKQADFVLQQGKKRKRRARKKTAKKKTNGHG